MCWNATVSLNTFLFSNFVLLLIYYNNTYTQYKIKEFDNVWLYVLFESFILMQLIEFFIWRNLNNKFYNNVFSILANILLIFQPITSMMLLSDHTIRNTLLSSYLLLTIPFALYNFATKYIHSEKSKNGHLMWHFVDESMMILILIWSVWLFFSLFSFVYEQKFIGGILFWAMALIFSYYNYIKDDTVGSMWCWAINLTMIYYAAYLLFSAIL